MLDTTRDFFSVTTLGVSIGRMSLASEEFSFSYEANTQLSVSVISAKLAVQILPQQGKALVFSSRNCGY
jgi:hypothetical protein